MLSTASGQIFVYGENVINQLALDNFFKTHDLQEFHTSNIYKLLQYAREINPKIMIFNLKESKTSTQETLKHFGESINPENYPIIVLRPDGIDFHTLPEVAHYLHIPQEINKLEDIIKSYTVGQQNHEILFLHHYSAKPELLQKQLNTENYRYFEVHNGETALLYLQKNTPQAILVEYSPQFIPARHQMVHPRIFYVDNKQDITEIKKFLR